MKKLLLALALMLSLSACKKKADTAAFEGVVKKALVDAGYADVKVSCPRDVSMKEGVKFTCTVKVGGDEFKLENTIGPVKDNQGSIADQQWVDGKAPPPPGEAPEGGDEGGDEKTE